MLKRLIKGQEIDDFEKNCQPGCIRDNACSSSVAPNNGIQKHIWSSEVNEGQSHVSHLTSHLSGNIFIVILLSLASFDMQHAYIQVILNFFYFLRSVN